MKKIIGLLLFFLGVIFFSCEEQLIFIDCSECLDNEPLNINLEIKVFSEENINVLITIYEGDLEDNIIYGTLSAFSRDVVRQTVSINKKYTVTARYEIADKIYIAVDSATPRVRFEESACENPCFYVYNNKLNLRLKGIR